MAVLSIKHPTLLTRAKMENPDGTIADIVPITAETNEMLMDLAVVEANDGSSHITTYDTDIPVPTWRQPNGGIQPATGATEQTVDTCGMLYALSECDKVIADRGGQSMKYRAELLRQHAQGFGEELASSLIYANTGSTPLKFMGLAPRFASQSGEQASNILTSAATPDGSDNTSIWIVGSSPRTIHLITPKGLPTGMKHTPYGEVMIENIDGSGGRMPGYRDMLEQHIGLVVRDWRYIVRIQYDLEDVVASGATGPVLKNLIRKGLRRLPSLNNVNVGIYMNRDSLDAMDLQANNDPTLAFPTVEDAYGKMVQSFMGFPIRRVDAILSTETGI